MLTIRLLFFMYCAMSSLLLCSNDARAGSIPSITLSSSSVTGGGIITGSVQFTPPLSANIPPAPVDITATGGAGSVTLADPNAPLNGSSLVPFVFSSNPVFSPTDEVIHVHTSVGDASAMVTVMPPSLANIIISASTGSSANNLTGYVQLTGQTAADLDVKLVTNNPEISVDSLVKVKKGFDTSDLFSVRCPSGAVPRSAVLRASTTLGGSSITKLVPISFGSQAKTTCLLNRGASVLITTGSAISSASVATGDLLVFNVAADVPAYTDGGGTLSRAIAIPKGNPAICRVVKSSRAGPFGSGSLTIEVLQVAAADGTFIPVVYDPKAYVQSIKSEHPTIKTVAIDKNTGHIHLSGQDAANTATLAPDQAKHTYVYGRTDNTAVLVALATLGTGYGMSRINMNDTDRLVTLNGVGSLVTGSVFGTLFSGVQSVLPAGVTFAVMTDAPAEVVVPNPEAGQ